MHCFAMHVLQDPPLSRSTWKNKRNYRKTKCFSRNDWRTWKFSAENSKNFVRAYKIMGRCMKKFVVRKFIIFCEIIANIGKIFFVANNGLPLKITILNSTTKESKKTLKSPRNILIFWLCWNVQYVLYKYTVYEPFRYQPLFLSVFCLFFGSSGFGYTVQCIHTLRLCLQSWSYSRFCPEATIVNKRRPFLCHHCNWLQIYPAPPVT